MGVTASLIYTLSGLIRVDIRIIDALHASLMYIVARGVTASLIYVTLSGLIRVDIRIIDALHASLVYAAHSGLSCVV
jgi:hypothetical protein